MPNIVAVDFNESTHHPEFAAFQWPDCITMVQSLPAGDFRIDKPDSTILIERKAPGDLMESIKDRRLFNQIADMVKTTPWVYVIIDGVLMPTGDGMTRYFSGGKWTDRAWEWGSIQGTLLSIQELGAAIVFETDMHAAIKRIMARSHNDIKVAPRRDAYVFSPAESFLMALPGIGSDKAQKLVGALHIPGICLEWLTGDFDQPKIDGIGPKTKHGIQAFLGGKIILDLGDGNNG
jgi:ERCC4-type nuclease